MRDEKFLAFDLSFSLSSRTSENARTFTSDLENERQNLFFNSKTEGKNSAQKTASSVQRRTSFARSKIQKNSKRILQNRQRENNEKSIRRRRSPLGRHSTHHHFVALIYILTAHLQSNVLATVERRVFLFETRRTPTRISRLFQRWYSRKR